MSWVAAVVDAAWQQLSQHPLLTAFMLLMIEEAGGPPLISGDLLMGLIGAEARAGRFGLVTAFVVLETASMIGGSILFAMTALGGRPFVERLFRFFGGSAPHLDRAASWLQRYGLPAVVVGRVTPGLSSMTTIACGLLGYPYTRFMPALLVGSSLRLAIFMALGYAIGPSVEALLSQVHVPIRVVLLIVVVAVLVGLAWHSLRRRASRPR